MRLPIDRVFTMRGFGTVVTGTLVSGSVRREDEVEIQPGRKRARVRGVEVHGEQTEAARAGERTALNFSGLAKEELHRGQMIVPTGVLRATRKFEVWLELLAEAKPLKNRSRVHLHAFTAEAVAEVMLHGRNELKPGEGAFAQLRIAEDQEAMLLLPQDRFIARQFSPVVTIGGGVVLDAHPMNKRLSGPGLEQFLTTLRDGGDAEKLSARIERRGMDGLGVKEAVLETGETEAALRKVALSLVGSGSIVEVTETWVSKSEWEKSGTAVLEVLREFHGKNPLAAGIGRDALRDKVRMREPLFSALLDAQAKSGSVMFAQDTVHLAGHKVRMRDDESAAHKQIEDAFKSAGLKVPTVKEVLMQLPIDRTRAQKIVAILLRDKVLVKISEELMFHASALTELRKLLAQEKTKSPRLDVGRFKELTGVSRKYAIPLLEWLDRERVTRRSGDARVIL